MSKEPIRHHYIPQFILKNFRMNENNDLCYFNLQTNQIIFTKPNVVFEVDNLYRDKINYPEYPVQIEKDLARYESEMAKIINEKLAVADEIVITKEENESLKLFLVLMGFRSIKAFETFSESMTKENKDFYLQWQPDGNFNDFWKRNLGYLVNCRSIEDVMKHPNIDDPIKSFMLRDTVSFFGTYFIVCEKRGSTNYIIGDCYPTRMIGDSPMRLFLYDMYPISPSRMILLAHDGVEYAQQSAILFNKKILKKHMPPSNNVHIYVEKMYEKDVENVNQEIIKNCEYGYIFKK